MLDPKLKMVLAGHTKEHLAKALETSLGWVMDLPSEVYHSPVGVSASGLKSILKSPATFNHGRTHKSEASPAMILGSAVHTAVLESDKFADEYTVKPLGTDRRTKAGKEAFESFEKANIGKTILGHEDWQLAKSMADRAKSHPVFSKMLASGVAEVSFFAKSASEILVKARPDLYIPSTGLLVDLKTTQDASPDAFIRTVINSKYHVQAAFHMEVVRWSGLPAAEFVFAAIEKEPPFEMGLYYLDPEMIAIGRGLAMEALTIYGRCMASGEWPGFPEKVTELKFPHWYTKQFESEI